MANAKNGNKASLAAQRTPRASASDKADRNLSWFARFAHETARYAGKPITFLICVALVVVWALTGPIFNFSDSWQLVINTSTTIVTFLMVFLIQNTQNRDALAFQIKLSELVLAMKGAPNRFASVEDLSDEELEKLHDECHRHAAIASEHAEHVKRALAKRRRQAQTKKK